METTRKRARSSESLPDSSTNKKSLTSKNPVSPSTTSTKKAGATDVPRNREVQMLEDRWDADHLVKRSSRRLKGWSSRGRRRMHEEGSSRQNAASGSTHSVSRRWSDSPRARDRDSRVTPSGREDGYHPRDRRGDDTESRSRRRHSVSEPGRARGPEVREDAPGRPGYSEGGAGKDSRAKQTPSCSDVRRGDSHLDRGSSPSSSRERSDRRRERGSAKRSTRTTSHGKEKDGDRERSSSKSRERDEAGMPDCPPSLRTRSSLLSGRRSQTATLQGSADPSGGEGMRTTRSKEKRKEDSGKWQESRTQGETSGSGGRRDCTPVKSKSRSCRKSAAKVRRSVSHTRSSAESTERSKSRERLRKLIATDRHGGRQGNYSSTRRRSRSRSSSSVASSSGETVASTEEMASPTRSGNRPQREKDGARLELHATEDRGRQGSLPTETPKKARASRLSTSLSRNSKANDPHGSSGDEDHGDDDDDDDDMESAGSTSEGVSGDRTESRARSHHPRQPAATSKLKSGGEKATAYRHENVFSKFTKLLSTECLGNRKGASVKTGASESTTRDPGGLGRSKRTRMETGGSGDLAEPAADKDSERISEADDADESKSGDNADATRKSGLRRSMRHSLRSHGEEERWTSAEHQRSPVPGSGSDKECSGKSDRWNLPPAPAWSGRSGTRGGSDDDDNISGGERSCASVAIFPSEVRSKQKHKDRDGEKKTGTSKREKEPDNKDSETRLLETTEGDPNVAKRPKRSLSCGDSDEESSTKRTRPLHGRSSHEGQASNREGFERFGGELKQRPRPTWDTQEVTPVFQGHSQGHEFEGGADSGREVSDNQHETFASGKRVRCSTSQTDDDSGDEPTTSHFERKRPKLSVGEAEAEMVVPTGVESQTGRTDRGRQVGSILAEELARVSLESPCSTDPPGQRGEPARCTSGRATLLATASPLLVSGLPGNIAEVWETTGDGGKKQESECREQSSEGGDVPRTKAAAEMTPSSSHVVERPTEPKQGQVVLKVKSAESRSPRSALSPTTASHRTSTIISTPSGSRPVTVTVRHSWSPARSGVSTGVPTLISLLSRKEDFTPLQIGLSPILPATGTTSGDSEAAREKEKVKREGPDTPMQKGKQAQKVCVHKSQSTCSTAGKKAASSTEEFKLECAHALLAIGDWKTKSSQDADVETSSTDQSPRLNSSPVSKSEGKGGATPPKSGSVGKSAEYKSLISRENISEGHGKSQRESSSGDAKSLEFREAPSATVKTDPTKSTERKKERATAEGKPSNRCQSKQDSTAEDSVTSHASSEGVPSRDSAVPSSPREDDGALPECRAKVTVAPASRGRKILGPEILSETSLPHDADTTQQQRASGPLGRERAETEKTDSDCLLRAALESSSYEDVRHDILPDDPERLSVAEDGSGAGDDEPSMPSLTREVDPLSESPERPRVLRDRVSVSPGGGDPVHAEVNASKKSLQVSSSSAEVSPTRSLPPLLAAKPSKTDQASPSHRSGGGTPVPEKSRQAVGFSAPWLRITPARCRRSHPRTASPKSVAGVVETVEAHSATKSKKTPSGDDGSERDHGNEPRQAEEKTGTNKDGGKCKSQTGTGGSVSSSSSSSSSSGFSEDPKDGGENPSGDHDQGVSSAPERCRTRSATSSGVLTRRFYDKPPCSCLGERRTGLTTPRSAGTKGAPASSCSGNSLESIPGSTGTLSQKAGSGRGDQQEKPQKRAMALSSSSKLKKKKNKNLKFSRKKKGSKKSRGQAEAKDDDHTQEVDISKTGGQTEASTLSVGTGSKDSPKGEEKPEKPAADKCPRKEHACKGSPGTLQSSLSKPGSSSGDEGVAGSNLQCEANVSGSPGMKARPHSVNTATTDVTSVATESASASGAVSSGLEGTSADVEGSTHPESSSFQTTASQASATSSAKPKKKKSVWKKSKRDILSKAQGLLKRSKQQKKPRKRPAGAAPLGRKEDVLSDVESDPPGETEEGEEGGVPLLMTFNLFGEASSGAQSGDTLLSAPLLDPSDFGGELTELRAVQQSASSLKVYVRKRPKSDSCEEESSASKKLKTAQSPESDDQLSETGGSDTSSLAEAVQAAQAKARGMVTSKGDLTASQVLDKHACLLWSSENRRHFQLLHPRASCSELDEVMRVQWRRLAHPEKIRYFQRARNASIDEDRHSERRRSSRSSCRTSKRYTLLPQRHFFSSQPARMPIRGNAREQPPSAMEQFSLLRASRQKELLKKWLQFYQRVLSRQQYQSFMEEYQEELQRLKAGIVPAPKKTKNRLGREMGQMQRKLLFEKMRAIKPRVIHLYDEQQRVRRQLLEDSFHQVVKRLIEGRAVQFEPGLRSERLTRVLECLGLPTEDADTGDAPQISSPEDSRQSQPRPPGQVKTVDPNRTSEIADTSPLGSVHLPEKRQFLVGASASGKDAACQEASEDLPRYSASAVDVPGLPVFRSASSTSMRECGRQGGSGGVTSSASGASQGAGSLLNDLPELGNTPLVESILENLKYVTSLPVLNPDALEEYFESIEKRSSPKAVDAACLALPARMDPGVAGGGAMVGAGGMGGGVGVGGGSGIGGGGGVGGAGGMGAGIGGGGGVGGTGGIGGAGAREAMLCKAEGWTARYVRTSRALELALPAPRSPAVFHAPHPYCRHPPRPPFPASGVTPTSSGAYVGSQGEARFDPGLDFHARRSYLPPPVMQFGYQMASAHYGACMTSPRGYSQATPTDVLLGEANAAFLRSRHCNVHACCSMDSPSCLLSTLVAAERSLETPRPPRPMPAPSLRMEGGLFAPPMDKGRGGSRM